MNNSPIEVEGVAFFEEDSRSSSGRRGYTSWSSLESPEVFDKLIAAHEMPVTIGIFVTPGVDWPTADARILR